MADELPQEYEDAIGALGGLEKFGDKFTSTDQRADALAVFFNKKTNQVLNAISQLGGLAGGDMVQGNENIREFRIQQNVPLNTGVILNQTPPFDGIIREVKIHWPPGCNGLVDVRVGHGPKQFCPFEGFLSLNNVTPSYYFNEEVQHTEQIWVEIQNTDGVNAHTISVMFNMVEKING